MNTSIRNNECKNLIPITSLDTVKIQDFLYNGWKEFFNPGNKNEAISKRKDLQDPVRFYKNHNGDFWYLEENDKVIATIAVHEILFRSKKVGFLRRFYIEKDFRSKGLGSTILKFVENYSNQKKWKYLMFGVDDSMERNKRFYLRNGYEEFNMDVPQEIIDDNDTWYLKKKIK